MIKVFFSKTLEFERYFLNCNLTSFSDSKYSVWDPFALAVNRAFFARFSLPTPGAIELYANEKVLIIWKSADAKFCYVQKMLTKLMEQWPHTTCAIRYTFFQTQKVMDIIKPSALVSTFWNIDQTSILQRLQFFLSKTDLFP